MRVLTALDRFNQRHPWSHNDRFLGWVEHRVAASGAREVLDVGCGTGNLVDRLRRDARVVGLEPDPATAAIAASRFADDPAVHIEAHSFAERNPHRRWDAITLVAVLHHLPLESTLRELRSALRAGGRLVIVGCYRAVGAVDLTLAAVSLLANPVVGLIRHPRRAQMLPEHMRAPTAAAAHTFGEIVAAAERELPGARIRRRLFWRYTLIYDAPGAAAGAGPRPDSGRGLLRRVPGRAGPLWARCRRCASFRPEATTATMGQVDETNEVIIPIFRVDDADVAVRWYARLGFAKQWEHRFEPGMPAFVLVARGHAQLYLSEHTGDATPGTLVSLHVRDVDAVASEFGVAVRELPWGRQVWLDDPDGNRLRVGASTTT